MEAQICAHLVSAISMCKKSPQIVGLGPPMGSQIFWLVNFNANQLNILVHLPLL